MKRFRSRSIFLLLALIAAALVVWVFWPLRAPELVLSRRTTYLTAPLHPDGTVDYRTVVEETLKRGVTPETNAAVELLRAVGPRALDDDERRPRLLEALGLAGLPEAGDYLAPLPDEARYRPIEQLLGDSILEAWLEANRGPLEWMAAASKKSRFHLPLIARGSTPRLVGAADLDWALIRSGATALLMRSRTRLQAGDSQGAREDALAVIRLGSLATQNWTIISNLVGDSLRLLGCDALRDIVKAGGIDAPAARRMMAELRSLPRVPGTAERLRTARFFFLDAAMTSLTSAREEGALAILPGSRLALALDLNAILDECNAWFDRYEAALKKGTIPAQLAEIRALNYRLHSEVNEWSRAKDSTGGWLRHLLKSPSRRREADSRSVLKAFLTGVFRSDFSRTVEVDTRIDLSIASLALAAWRVERGSYPEELAALAPLYLESVPTDPFSGAPLRYLRRGSGYVLYSIGKDLKDGGGSEEDGDDIAVAVD